MIKCEACGFNNPDGRERCFRCSARLSPIAVEAAPDLEQRMAPRLIERLRVLWYLTLEKFRGELPSNVPYRLPFVSGLLSVIIPGLGQLYNHQPARGALVFLGAAVAWAVSILTIKWDYSNYVLACLLLVHLFAYADAMSVSARLNGQLWSFKRLLAVVTWLLFVVSVTSTLGQYFGQGIFKLVYVASGDDYGDFLHHGDRVFVARWPLLTGTRLPRRGDMIYYNPPGYRRVVVGDLNTEEKWIDPANGFERVNGVPGDDLEVTQQGSLLINGKPAPPAWDLSRPEGAVPGLRLTIPADHVGAIICSGVSEFSLGPSWGGSAPPPSVAPESLRDFEKACTPARKDIEGVVLFCYNPPSRRRWIRPPDAIQP